MKASEFITEDNISIPGGKKSKSGKLHFHHKSAIKGMETHPELPGWAYNMYRFGVDMAGSPDSEHKLDPKSATANHLTTLAYTDADAEIINKSKKNMGLGGKSLTSKESLEPEDTHKSSPVAKIKRNKYGI